MSDDNNNKEEYKGFGKVTGTVGGWLMASLPFNVVFRGSHLADIKKAVETGHGVDSLKVTSKQTILLATASVLAGIGGAVWGYNKSKNSQKQFTDMMDQRDQANSKLEVAHTELSYAKKHGKEGKDKDAENSEIER